MKRLSTRNYEHNQKIPLPAEPINGQSLGAVSDMKYGRSTVSYSGCEVIAVYNALWLAGTPHPFPEIARYMERFRILFGYWGANLFLLGHCLRHYGLYAKRVRRQRKITEALANGQTALLVYWVGKRFRSPVHTVCIRAGHAGHTGQICVYNQYNNCDHAVHLTEDALFEKHVLFAYLTGKEPANPKHE